MTEKIQYEKLGSLGWDRGRLDVQALGGMLGPVEVVLDDGRAIRPFAVAPWADNPTEDWEATAPPLLKRLRGDWVCLPFGLPGKPRTDLDADWLDGLDANLESPDPAQHGACSNADWRLEKAEPHALVDELRARCEVPDFPDRASHFGGRRRSDHHGRDAHRRARGLRTAMGRAIRPSACREEPGAFEIGFGGDVTAFTYPGFFEAGRVARRARADRAPGSTRSPCSTARVQSFAALPLPFDTEEILLVAGHNGVARLTNRAEGYRVVMEWDPGVFPGVLLWVSNRGRRYAPWNGRNLCLGVEPVCAPFDLGYAHAVNPKSPLRARGVATATRFSPERDSRRATGSGSRACDMRRREC